ncbi:MAG: AAA family ATPase, partial [Chloroflexales bacterium]|nr:AAA family ATPase [Chloroflexales bacterium]
MTQSLDVYLPMDRRQALVRGVPIPEQSAGVALLADVAGFTPLAEVLVRALGPLRGAEEVTALLNQAYGALIAAVDTFGGSVVCFSGDAITCWFAPPKEGGVAHDATLPATSVALRATACALAMQHAMGAFAAIPLPGGATAALSVKVAVVAGGARRLLVGDPSLQRYEVLAGGLLDRLAALQHQACSGEVLLEEALGRQLDARLCAARRETPSGESVVAVTGLADAVAPHPWPPLPTTLADDVCKQWLLPAVAARLAHTPSHFLAELRPAVALMLEFHGLDYDADERAGTHLDAYIRWVQQIVARYQGALIDLTMGDRGSYLYAVWGAPEVHDDDATCAVAAARELLAPPQEFHWLAQVRIGMARGTLWSGAYGGPTRRTYGVLGDATNLAFRLMSKAPASALWCDYAVARAAERGWAFAGLPPVRVKGKAGLIRVYEPLVPSEHRAPPADSPLVGRVAEQAQLAAVLDAVAAGGSRVVVLEGEAGIGKSRLVGELA